MAPMLSRGVWMCYSTATKLSIISTFKFSITWKDAHGFSKAQCTHHCLLHIPLKNVYKCMNRNWTHKKAHSFITKTINRRWCTVIVTYRTLRTALNNNKGQKRSTQTLCSITTACGSHTMFNKPQNLDPKSTQSRKLQSVKMPEKVTNLLKQSNNLI